jgi:hypothetical protein
VVKTITLGQIVPYGLSRRIDPSRPAESEYLLLVPLFVKKSIRWDYGIRRMRQGWWVLVLGINLSRLQVRVWWCL